MRTLFLVAILSAVAITPALAGNPELVDDSGIYGSWIATDDISLQQGTQTTTLTLQGDTFSIDFQSDGTADVSGRIERVGNALSFGEDRDGSACPKGVNGFYRYYLVDQQLLLKPITEACASRQGVLERRWRKR